MAWTSVVIGICSCVHVDREAVCCINHHLILPLSVSYSTHISEDRTGCWVVTELGIDIGIDICPYGP